ncbi:hypothetical protein LUX41_06640 [Klebsiella pneumoniae]|uniref:hypothetical protein n=1 Tax=Klebsiella pneumoniae TaxID=573 RepID=UPI00240DF56F|nr:hypothetical protein [Klebsiella pneumoniae]WFA31440.1 hypothetical protein LUX41_06640 [Klebsiella pneumoniae]
MTDITELAQRLKLEVHRAVSNFNPQMNIKTRDLKELVEALEKARATEAHCNRGWIEAHEQEARAEAAEQRIAELESRTVKLPTQIEFDDPLSAYEAIEKCKEALAAAGIKVEAE